jgi:hypothetical protein
MGQAKLTPNSTAVTIEAEQNKLGRKVWVVIERAAYEFWAVSLENRRGDELASAMGTDLNQAICEAFQQLRKGG